jgi:ABC-2 type transport system ATP-binding protein
VAVARTLLHDPEVLILDEPTNGLDPQARIEMRQLLLNLSKRGKTLIVTSHVLPELSRISDRIAIITRGRLRAFGTLAEVSRQLSPLRTMEVMLTRPDSVARVAEMVRQYVEPDAEVHTSPAESVVRFQTARREEELTGLLAALVSARLDVTQFREVQTDLEDAYLMAARSDGEAVGRNQASGVRSQESGVRGQESGVRNQESGVSDKR